MGTRVFDLSVASFAKHNSLAVLMLASWRFYVCEIRQPHSLVDVDHRWVTILPVIPGMTVDLKEKEITIGLIERGAHGDQPLIERL
jgi:hypothetical protein